MRRVSVLSQTVAVQSKFFFLNLNSKWLLHRLESEFYATSSSSTASTPILERINVSLSECFSNCWKYGNLGLDRTMDKLEDELLSAGDNVLQVLEEKVRPIMFRWINGFSFLRLMDGLLKSPSLAIEVLNWRRKQGESGFPMRKEEYSKSITIAGRLSKVNLAIDLFKEACDKGLKTTSTCNAMLGVFMYNCHPEECFNLFKLMKNDSLCAPSIVTMNMILSVYGQIMMIPQMEHALQDIVKLKLHPNVTTFNTIIEGYLISWKWETMETTYAILLRSPIKPNTRTFQLMLRGYAVSGNIKKMEEIYSILKHRSSSHLKPVIKCMICAYLKSSSPNRVEMVETLLRSIPGKDYFPWLNVLLIKFYAKEDLIEKMEARINEAFMRNTRVLTRHVMRAIIATYYRFHALEKLTEFVKRAERGGWVLCKSLYHCKMIMCGGKGLLEEMESVLNEMKDSRLDINKKTLVILLQSYLAYDHSDKVQLVVGFMYKNGYVVPAGILDGC